MAKNELLPFANGEDANVLPTQQWEALTDILENGFQSGVARSEQVNRVLAQGAVASYVLGQLIVDQLSKDATLDKNALYQNLILALQENAKDACLPLSGGNVTGNLTVQSKNVVRSVNGVVADPSGNVALSDAYVTETWSNGTNWYRKWSDGWIEQGGCTSEITTNQTTTINFPVAFSNTNYTVSTAWQAVDSEGDCGRLPVVNNTLSTSYMKITSSGWTNTNNGMNVFWRAEGY